MKKINLFQSILFGVNRLVFQTYGPADYSVSGELKAPEPVQAEEIEAQERAAGRKTPEELARAAEAVGQSGKKVVEKQKETLAKAEEMLDEVAKPKVDKTLAFLKRQGIKEKALIGYLKDQYYLDERTAYAPTPSQMLEAIKKFQEDLGMQGKDIDGIIGKHTFAKMEAIPSLTVALKQTSEKESEFETMVEKGTMYRYRDAAGNRKRAFLAENTPALVLKETPQQYVAQITMDGKEVTVEIPKGLTGKRVALSPAITEPGLRTMTEPGSAAASAESEKREIRPAFEGEIDTSLRKLQKSKKSFNK